MPPPSGPSRSHWGPAGGSAAGCRRPSHACRRKPERTPPSARRSPGPANRPRRGNCDAEADEGQFGEQEAPRGRWRPTIVFGHSAKGVGRRHRADEGNALGRGHRFRATGTEKGHAEPNSSGYRSPGRQLLPGHPRGSGRRFSGIHSAAVALPPGRGPEPSRSRADAAGDGREPAAGGGRIGVLLGPRPGAT